MTCSAMLAQTCLLLTLQSAGTIEIREVLTLEPVGSGGRVPIVTNALTSQVVAGSFKPPVAGDSVTSVTGQSRTWTKEEAGADGAINSRAFRGGFAFATVQSESARVMMLEAAGHSYVYINGELRGGDPYSYGFYRVPVQLKRGMNTLLFNVGRGSLRARLIAPESDRVFLENRDSTLPDVIVGEDGELWGSIAVTNPTTRTVTDGSIRARMPGGEPVTTRIESIPPLTTLKYAFRFRPPVFKTAGRAPLNVQLVQPIDRQPSASEVTVDLEVKAIHDLHKRTYFSTIDNSVQYYAVRPPFEANVKAADALVLTVHGAGVEATGQAAAYGAKSWAWIVAATNRRPFGFDWEDWGRLEALEALEDAKQRYRPREDRIYLTGHSMGGHGTWYLGATHPDTWGAIGPAAGWSTFWSYGGAVRYPEPDPVEALLVRSANPSDITKILRNYLHHGVFVLHGDADETVPVAQARQMRESLSAFHRDVDWFEQPGGGHWYDATPEPGADCVDFGPMFEFFDKRRRRLSHEVRRVEFHTVSPSVSSRSHWVEIVQQEAQLNPSSVVATNPIGTQRFEVETSNVALLALHVGSSPLPSKEAKFEVAIDGSEIKDLQASEGAIFLRKTSDGWKAQQSAPWLEKSPTRGSLLRSAFKNRFVLVYGTTGTPEENAWSYAKARYDAETWWLRGNGHAMIVPDTNFQPRTMYRAVNYILYGNEDSNSALKMFLQGSPVHIKRNLLTIADIQLSGDDLSILMTRPADPDRVVDGDIRIAYPQIAIVGGTGIKGMRSTDLMPYFVSGVHYPDVFVYDSRIHTIGSKAVRVAGFFGNDWSVERGEFAWRE